MTCDYHKLCGGCSYRDTSISEYQSKKCEVFSNLIKSLPQKDINIAVPVFITDGCRRRASFAFKYSKGQLTFGFNQRQSENLVDVTKCLSLTKKINDNLDIIRNLCADICKIPIIHIKKKKQIVSNVASGDILVCEADNGLDLVFEFDNDLTLDHRMTIFEQVQSQPDIIRVSHRKKANDLVEPIVEKTKPIIKIAGFDILIPAGTFLQASKAGEKALTDLVLKYLGNTEGNIADLFCGVGTLSYPLALNKNNKITAIDSSKSLLDGFRQSINKNMIPNIEVIEKNLFKYPLDEKELSKFSAIVIDPPRAGASSQFEMISKVSDKDKPSKIIAVSCNPHSFIKDASILINSGYKLEEITMVDQFVYSNHNELVALFTLIPIVDKLKNKGDYTW